MNLREQIEKEITEKVMTKLASEKVELGLIDDIKKLNNEFQNIFSEDLKLRTEMSKLNRKAKDLDKLYKGKVKEARKIANETSQKIKDLGLKEPPPLQALYDSFTAEPYKDIVAQIK